MNQSNQFQKWDVFWFWWFFLLSRTAQQVTLPLSDWVSEWVTFWFWSIIQAIGRNLWPAIVPNKTFETSFENFVQFWQFWTILTTLTILDNLDNFGLFCTILVLYNFGNFDNFDTLGNPIDLWHLRHWLQFWQVKIWIHDNLCYLTIKSDNGQHSQFLQCFI